MRAASAAHTRHSPVHSNQDPRRHHHQWSECVRTCEDRYQLVRAYNVCLESHACRHTAWTTPHYKLCTDRSSSLSCSMHSACLVGFTNSSDRQHVEAFIRRIARCNFAPVDLGSFEQLRKTLMSGCSTAFSATQITFCTIYCLRNPKHL